MTAKARAMTVASIEIRVLGPVEVVDGDRTAPLGGPRPRTLIGALALRAPAVVSRDALAEAVWDTHLPPGAAKTLRAHVAYLRRALSAGGFGELVTTRAPGYALTVPIERIDVHRFQELLDRARATPAAGTTAETLRVALGLWRGDVLAGCQAGDWVRAEATRLEELRLGATEDLLAAELAVGRHAAATPELESLVARFPLRERLWELLMLALYRAGRQGDALAAYRRARARLVTEIGVEPGAGLQRLEAAILAGRELPAASESVPVGGEPVGCGVPAPLTTLIGRDAEIAELSALLAQRRLITLTGVGGCGKTRLAVAVAERVAGRFPGGVQFVDLAPLADPGLVAAELAPADALRGRNCLLVLDNCEHVVAACGGLVGALLRACPDLRVLATSRETLGVPGELAWPVPPLSTPPVTGTPGLAALSRYDAVRLFLDRAAVSAVRALGDGDAPDIAALCARLDGLPLAIELAAARTAVLTVAEITDRLHDPALLRTSCQPDRPQHQAMHSTIAWSYDLLDAPTQDRFRRLAVFAGGFTLAAAEAVWGDPAAVDQLADLVGKSLVVVEHTAAGARYRLLETIGRWAARKLSGVPAAERAARDAHAGYYLALAEEADRQLRRPETGGWLARLAAEHENLRAALAWFAGGGGDPGAQLRLAVALAQYCQLRGRYGEGRRWLETALARESAGPRSLVGCALWATAGFALLTCDYHDAQRLGERALGLLRQCGDRIGEARTLRLLASVARERGEYRRALAELDRAMNLVEPGDIPATAAVQHQIGFTHWLAGDLDAAERSLTEALRWSESLGDPVGLASGSTHLAAVALHRGQLGRADRLARDGLARSTELDLKEHIAWAWNVIGLIALRRNQSCAAVGALRTSLELHWAIGDRWRQAGVLDHLAEAVLAGGGASCAAELAGLATAIRDVLAVPVPAQEQPGRSRTQARLRRCLPDPERRAAANRGATRTVPEVITALQAPAGLRPITA
ncbi:MAG TPA: BTAD domain-containing putative transcriptional regulator [Actinophytocola sp.]|uniref:BTAD domain-containing putative transcriptional regulator n=1 Tax=Actinophytocola sp. TaxID=1872138 RepID=UPI002DBF69EA|nr:BTAD domain-containing putative transcriptional regulator [Actinophytocola sp.]HEU5470251.1 BTAD domain-containing putative transcriptional regulator [Actinophytocola sp.]